MLSLGSNDAIAAPAEGRASSTARLAVLGGVEGAVIRVDGRIVGSMPLRQPLAVEGGAHELRVSADGYEPYARRVRVGPRRTARVRVVLVRSQRSSQERSARAYASL